MSTFRVALAQYDIGYFRQWSEYVEKMQQWIGKAASNEAKLVVMPEYGSMELSSLFGESVYRDLQKQLAAMQRILPDWLSLQADLARQYDVTLISATYPVLTQDGVYVNRGHIHGPNGLLGIQDKLIMTRFEREQWNVCAGSSLNVIDTDVGRLGVLICYDSEFPLLARHLIEDGADLLIAPSCTDTDAGFHRVRIACQARALENQCYVLQCPTVGQAPWSPAVDVNIGRASVYTPVDSGFPSNGILVEGDASRPQWVYADLDLARAANVRREGQVTNHQDWDRQRAVLSSCPLPKS